MLTFDLMPHTFVGGQAQVVDPRVGPDQMSVNLQSGARSVEQTHGVEPAEVCVVSLAAAFTAAGAIPSLVFGSVLFGPPEMAEESWLDWRREPITTGPSARTSYGPLASTSASGESFHTNRTVGSSSDGSFPRTEGMARWRTSWSLSSTAQPRRVAAMS